jgi:hypothetical protein
MKMKALGIASALALSVALPAFADDAPVVAPVNPAPVVAAPPAAPSDSRMMMQDDHQKMMDNKEERHAKMEEWKRHHREKMEERRRMHEEQMKRMDSAPVAPVVAPRLGLGV